MKTISKKQFENAVEKVLNGGKSSFVTTSEVYPFYWVRSKGHNNLKGETPKYSKFLRNTGRGGRASDLYLVCKIASGYIIAETKKEAETREKREAKKAELKKQLAKKAREAKKAKFEEIANEFGLTTKEYTAKLKELELINNKIREEYEAKRNELLNNFEGKDAMFKVLNRIKFERVVADAKIYPQYKKIEDILSLK